MNNPFNNLPSYIKESPKFSRFLELTNAYLLSGAIEVARLKESFLWDTKSTFVIQSLASQIGATVDIPFVDGEPDMTTYFARLFMAYRARAFVLAFKGASADLITGDPIKDSAALVVLDFSVAKENRTPMSVVYSCLSMDENLTIDIVRDSLIPRVTGVNANLYYLQFGQDVFGYDVDEKFDATDPKNVIGKRITYPNGVPTEESFSSPKGKGYYIRGFDSGTFISISRRS